MSTVSTSSDPHRRNNDGGQLAHRLLRSSSCRADDKAPCLLFDRLGQNWDFLAGTHASAWCALPAWLIDSKIMEAMCERGHGYPLRGKVKIVDAYLGG